MTTISGTQANQAVAYGNAVDPFDSVTVSDTSAGASETVTVTLSNAGGSVLSDPAGGSFNASTGVYTVSGTPQAVTAALDALEFTPFGTVTLNGAGLTAVLTRAIG